MYGFRRFLYWTPFRPANQHEAIAVGRGRRHEGAGMGLGVGVGAIFLLLAVLWLLQLGLTYQQAQRFLARARALRRQGRVTIGASPRKLRGRAYVVLAVGPDDRVTAAEVLRGVTVFADARPEPALLGLVAAELAAGSQVPGLAPRVRAAARQAAAILHPEHAGAFTGTGRGPHRRRRPRGGVATS
jgi:DNA-binding transcriptional regulator of glucitol operon